MIKIIKNQPINLHVETIDESCECLGQNFCQLINKNDPTQFQIESINNITNGTFLIDLTNWRIFESINVLAAITNASLIDVCDGVLVISATGGTPAHTYSINGGSFVVGNTFSNLCAGSYTVTVRDSLGDEGEATVQVFTNVSCGTYSGATIQDLINDGVTLGQIYNCTLDDLQP